MTATLVSYGGSLLSAGGVLLSACCVPGRWAQSVTYVCDFECSPDSGVLDDQSYYLLGVAAIVTAWPGGAPASGWDGSLPGTLYGPIHGGGCPTPAESDIPAVVFPAQNTKGPGDIVWATCAASYEACPPECEENYKCVYVIAVSGFEDSDPDPGDGHILPWSELNQELTVAWSGYAAADQGHWTAQTEFNEAGHPKQIFFDLKRFFVPQEPDCLVQQAYWLLEVVAYPSAGADDHISTVFVLGDVAGGEPIGWYPPVTTLGEEMCAGPAVIGWAWCDDYPGDPPFPAICKAWRVIGGAALTPKGSPSVIVTAPVGGAMFGTGRRVSASPSVVAAAPHPSDIERVKIRFAICKTCEQAEREGFSCRSHEGCCFGRFRAKPESKCPRGQW